MKKIAFFVQHMLCGGVENALLALAEELIKSGNKITIYVIRRTGKFIDRVPENILLRKIPMPKKTEEYLPVGGTKLSVRKNLEEHHYIRAFHNIKNHLIGSTGFAELNVNFDQIPKLPDSYDIAVNFHIHSPFLVRYVAEKVTAKVKYAWIHNDFTTTGYEIEKLSRYLSSYAGFFAVSRKIKEEFIDIFPEYLDKTEVAYNIIPVEEIKEKAGKEAAEEFNHVPENNTVILSVGRLESQKGYDLTLKACRHLLEKGLKFKWFILGEGTERRKLENSIKKLGLEDTVYLLGVRMNPYPYFKNCDIYVQTSKHEGYVTTVTEAKIFNRPIVCTDVSGAKEQILNGETGFIVDFDVDQIVQKVLLLGTNIQLRTEFSRNIRKYNSSEMNKNCLNIFQ
jgi:glycosyltransferase involved in cell wall biosynthesis